MTVTVEFTAVMNVPNISSGAQVELPPQATIHDLLKTIGIDARHMRFVVAVVNGKHVRANQRLSDGDHVLLSLPIGGG